MQGNIIARNILSLANSGPRRSHVMKREILFQNATFFRFPSIPRNNQSFSAMITQYSFKIDRGGCRRVLPFARNLGIDGILRTRGRFFKAYEAGLRRGPELKLYCAILLLTWLSTDFSRRGLQFWAKKLL